MDSFSLADSELQQKVLERAIDLSWNGFGYSKIIQTISKEFSVKLSKGTLSYWFNNNVSMYGGSNSFVAKPSAELAYILASYLVTGAYILIKRRKIILLFCLRLTRILLKSSQNVLQRF